MNEKIQINLNPSESNFLELEKWLIDEYNKFHEGFYCNWNMIEKSYEDNEIITFSLDNKIIGFADWSLDDKTIHINIMEIHPDYRKMGLGKKFFEKLELEFTKQGYIAFVLFCEPRESEYFWRKMGFIKFPVRGWSESDLTFYKPLIKVLETTQNADNSNKFELWNVEPHEINRVPPKWTWNIDNNELDKPIIQPCNCNWFVRWTMNGEIKKEGKIKYFSKDYSIENGPFIFIETLK